MRRIKKIFYASVCALLAIVASGCTDYDEPELSIRGVFDQIWTTMDERYCFFGEKNVNWNRVYNEYSARINDGTNAVDLFFICSEMLGELKDGHVNLSSPFDVSYYREWWTAYPQDFNLRTIQEYYLHFDYHTTCGIIYQGLGADIGYMYYPSFAYKVGNLNLDYILSYFRDCKALIIDVRDNGGGDLTNIKPFVSRLIKEPVTRGYIYHKTGPEHDAFSEPYPVEYLPAGENNLRWDKPVIVLTNRSCYSAANDFVSVMKGLPGVTVIGARTGGGGGIPFTVDLPNGWRLRFSASPMLNADKQSIEQGIDPDIEVHSTETEPALGRDAILDRAIQYIESL